MIATGLDPGIYRAIVSSQLSSTLQSCTISQTSINYEIIEENLTINNILTRQDFSICYESDDSGILEFDLVNTLLRIPLR